MCVCVCVRERFGVVLCWPSLWMTDLCYDCGRRKRNRANNASIISLSPLSKKTLLTGLVGTFCFISIAVKRLFLWQITELFTLTGGTMRFLFIFLHKEGNQPISKQRTATYVPHESQTWDHWATSCVFVTLDLGITVTGITMHLNYIWSQPVF